LVPIPRTNVAARASVVVVIITGRHRSGSGVGWRNGSVSIVAAMMVELSVAELLFLAFAEISFSFRGRNRGDMVAVG